MFDHRSAIILASQVLSLLTLESKITHLLRHDEQLDLAEVFTELLFKPVCQQVYCIELARSQLIAKPRMLDVAVPSLGDLLVQTLRCFLVSYIRFDFEVLGDLGVQLRHRCFQSRLALHRSFTI